MKFSLVKLNVLRALALSIILVGCSENGYTPTPTNQALTNPTGYNPYYPNGVGTNYNTVPQNVVPPVAYNNNYQNYNPSMNNPCVNPCLTSMVNPCNNPCIQQNAQLQFQLQFQLQLQARRECQVLPPYIPPNCDSSRYANYFVRSSSSSCTSRRVVQSCRTEDTGCARIRIVSNCDETPSRVIVRITENNSKPDTENSNRETAPAQEKPTVKFDINHRDNGVPLTLTGSDAKALYERLGYAEDNRIPGKSIKNAISFVCVKETEVTKKHVFRADETQPKYTCTFEIFPTTVVGHKATNGKDDGHSAGSPLFNLPPFMVKDPTVAGKDYPSEEESKTVDADDGKLLLVGKPASEDKQEIGLIIIRSDIKESNSEPARLYEALEGDGSIEQLYGFGEVKAEEKFSIPLGTVKRGQVVKCYKKINIVTKVVDNKTVNEEQGIYECSIRVNTKTGEMLAPVEFKSDAPSSAPAVDANANTAAPVTPAPAVTPAVTPEGTAPQGTTAPAGVTPDATLAAPSENKPIVTPEEPKSENGVSNLDASNPAGQKNAVKKPATPPKKKAKKTTTAPAKPAAKPAANKK